MRINIMVIIMVIILVGCNGTKCLKITGDYKGVSGGAEYCFSSEESKNVEKPIFVDNKDKKSILISEDDVKKINKLIGEKEPKDVKSGDVKTKALIIPIKENPFRALMKRLRQ